MAVRNDRSYGFQARRGRGLPEDPGTGAPDGAARAKDAGRSQPVAGVAAVGVAVAQPGWWARFKGALGSAFSGLGDGLGDLLSSIGDGVSSIDFGGGDSSSD
jgi:hypothetical protein